MPHDVGEMALMGLQTSVVAPALILATQRWGGWRRLTWPPAIALPLFLLAHVALTVWMAMSTPTVVEDAGFQVGLFAVSILFWLPVIGPARSLSDAGRMIYLFLAMPAMDLAGVFVVLHGDASGGLAMIVAMLPVGIAAVALTWRWVATEAALEVSGSARPITSDRAGPPGYRRSSWRPAQSPPG